MGLIAQLVSSRCRQTRIHERRSNAALARVTWSRVLICRVTFLAYRTSAPTYVRYGLYQALSTQILRLPMDGPYILGYEEVNVRK